MISLKIKLILFFLAAFLLSGLATFFIVQKNVTNVVEVEFEKRGISLARNLAENSLELILTDQFVELNHLLNRAIGTEDNVDYIFIVDSEGAIVASTFKENVPNNLIAANVVPLGEKISKQLFNSGEGRFLDVAVSITEGNSNVLRIGISRNNILKRINDAFIEIFLLIFVVYLSLASVLYFFIDRLIRPLAALSATASDIAKGNLAKRVSVLYNDEIGTLSKDFNEMAEKLEKSHVKLEQDVKARTKELEAAKNGLMKEVSRRTEELEAAKKDVEKQVQDRTEDLKKSIESLEVMNRAMSDRELKMVELKKKIKELEASSKKQ